MINHNDQWSISQKQSNYIQLYSNSLYQCTLGSHKKSKSEFQHGTNEPFVTVNITFWTTRNHFLSDKSKYQSNIILLDNKIIISNNLHWPKNEAVCLTEISTNLALENSANQIIKISKLLRVILVCLENCKLKFQRAI